MKPRLCILVALALLPFVGGCATSNYGANRGWDAADIFTFTLGAGSGVKARVGPIQPAIFQNADMVGLRCGQWLADGNLTAVNNDASGPLPVITRPNYGDAVVGHVFTTGSYTVDEYRTRDIVPHSRPHWTHWDSAFGHEIFSHGPDSVSHARGKDILAMSPFPFYSNGSPAPYYTQIELAVGLGLALRIGLNIGELVDFILGFSGADLYGDDYTPGEPRRLERAPRGPWKGDAPKPLREPKN